MKTVTAKELKTLDPKRFDKEYYKWCEYAADYDWADWIKKDYEAQMRGEGIVVENFAWSVSYSQDDGAAFNGHVKVHEWMEANPQYMEQYPALYLACKQDRSYVTVRTGFGMYIVASLEESWWTTEPDGIFTGLDKDAWDELVSDQFSSVNLEDEIKSTCERFMSDMYRTLRDEYEHITSEDSFVESCECNDITFELDTEEEDLAIPAQGGL